MLTPRVAALPSQGAANLDGKNGKVRCRAADKSAVQSAISAYGGEMKLTLDPTPLEEDSSVTNIKREW